VPAEWCWAQQVIDALLALKAVTDTGALPSAEVLGASRRLIVSAALIGAAAQDTPPGAVGRRHRALARRIHRRLQDYLRFATDPRAGALQSRGMVLTCGDPVDHAARTASRAAVGVQL
jgi:hypothetical protein